LKEPHPSDNRLFVNYVAFSSPVFKAVAADVIEQIRVSPYRGLSGRR